MQSRSDIIAHDFRCLFTLFNLWTLCYALYLVVGIYVCIQLAPRFDVLPPPSDEYIVAYIFGVLLYATGFLYIFTVELRRVVGKH